LLQFFEEFYHMQLKIYDRMDRLVDIGYFDVNSDSMNGFDERRGDIQERWKYLRCLDDEQNMRNDVM
ncbi:1643_t:CDS:1, partial [Ambispora gerdemannii]